MRRNPKPSNAGKGRPKGSLNKTTRAFKTALLEAFNALGGTHGLTAWGKRHPTAFYQICARLIPHEVIGPGADGEHVIKTIVHYPATDAGVRQE